MPASSPSRVLGRPAGWTCPSISCADDVASLPWIGNFASDSPLFAAVNSWAIESAPSIDAACRALFLAGSVGMGLDDDVATVTPDQFVDFCVEEGRLPVHFEVPGIVRIH